jgi:hypothetical protein
MGASMITFILTFLTAHLGTIAAILFGAAGVAFGGVKHLQAKAAIATAGQTVAQAQTQVANERASDAAADRTAIDAAQAAKSSQEVQDEINQLRR